MFSLLDYVNSRWQPRTIDDTMPTLNSYEIQSRLYEYAAEYSIEKYPSEHRHHLGISIIGDPCSRKIWYGFRWAKLIQHDPRIRRLFQRGHKEEKTFRDFLLWAGFHFRGVDADGKQFRISAVNGHYGGSTDDIALITWVDGIPVIVEYKTHNDKWFKDLQAKKVAASQPKHYEQMCGYGKDFKIKYGLYCAVNKNTDEWYFEFVELDWNRAIELEKKATDIIYSQTPPQKINENPSYFICKWCDMKGICHGGEAVEKNCRSCIRAFPMKNGEWGCEMYGPIPKEFLIKGCPEHKGIV